MPELLKLTRFLKLWDLHLLGVLSRLLVQFLWFSFKYRRCTCFVWLLETDCCNRLVVERSPLRLRCGRPFRSTITRLVSPLIVKMTAEKSSLWDDEVANRRLGSVGLLTVEVQIRLFSSAKLTASSTTVGYLFALPTERRNWPILQWMWWGGAHCAWHRRCKHFLKSQGVSGRRRLHLGRGVGKWTWLNFSGRRSLAVIAAGRDAWVHRSCLFGQ